MQTSTQAVRARTDEPFLERFIEAHEAFVLRCASRHAGFAVTRSDDEYSVALLAFYEAIKGYDPASGPFGAYASLVIGRRLADHYRSQHRFDAETPLAPQCGVSTRTITRHRDYIVAAALLIDGDYPILCTYLQTMRKEAEQCVR